MPKFVGTGRARPYYRHFDDNAQRWRELWDRMEIALAKFKDEHGGFGTEEEPLELEEWPPRNKAVMHAINHAHHDGKCVKSRYGFCKE